MQRLPPYSAAVASAAANPQHHAHGQVPGVAAAAPPPAFSNLLEYRKLTDKLQHRVAQVETASRKLLAEEQAAIAARDAVQSQVLEAERNLTELWIKLCALPESVDKLVIASDGYTYSEPQLAGYIQRCKEANAPPRSANDGSTLTDDWTPNLTYQAAIRALRAAATKPRSVHSRP